MEGDSPAGEGGPPTKRQRVTKACDQCRRRRIKCEAYPGAQVGATCRNCTEAGSADSCTFTRPSKKRGPQAGYAKNLAEKVSALERLLGHLLILQPQLSAACDSFFAPTCSTSTSAQTTAFNASSLPQQLEAHPVKGSPTSPGDSDSKSAPLPNPNAPSNGAPQQGSSAMSVEDRMSIKDAWSPPPLSNNGMSPGPLGSVGGPSSGALPMLSMGQRHAFGGASSSTSTLQLQLPSTASAMPYFSGADHGALQTLASAAVPDHDFYAGLQQGGLGGMAAFAASSRAMDIEGGGVSNGLGLSGGRAPQSMAGTSGMEGIMSEDAKFEQSTGLGSSSRLVIPTLPPESVRNQLLDLYQIVVHPSYPMVDKNRFFRWSAHLPTHNASNSPAALTLPPELFLAVYASVIPYLSPASAELTHPAEVFAAAGRDHLYHAMNAPTLETVQACVLLAMGDWGQGELERAWALSCLSIAISINLSLHTTATTVAAPPDPTSSRLMTFHSALILHTLLSIRTLRPPIIVLEDYDIPLPPIDGPENFELWRLDKNPAELRAQHGLVLSAAQAGRAGSGGQGHAVRSCALSTFSKMSSLCAIGISILRWGVCARRGNGQGLAVGEQERQELVASLQGWERDLPTDLRLSEGGQVRGVEKVEERSRHTIELHLVLFMLYLRLTPHSSFSTSFDPVPQALALLAHLIAQYRDLFTFLRSLPTVEATLDGLSRSLFLSTDYTPQQHDAPLRAYEELALVFPVARKGYEALRAKVDDHRRELGLVRGIHPTPSSSTALLPPSPPLPLPGTGEPFQAFLNYSTDLGPSANPSTILDFGSWDQSDLLVSLGLVAGGGELAGGWGMPPMGVEGVAQTNEAMPLPIEGVGEQDGAAGGVVGFGFNEPPRGEEGETMGEVWSRQTQVQEGAGQQQQQQATDLLSRWLGRGEMGGFGVGGGIEEGSA